MVRSSRHAAPPAAFTLIELLVVVAIIAILAAILMPTVLQSRDRGRLATCSSQLRQIHVSLVLYAQQNGDSFPVGFATGLTYKTSAKGLLVSNLADYVTHSNVFFCPGDSRLKPSVDWSKGNFSYYYMHYQGSAAQPHRMTDNGEALLMSDPWTDASWSTGAYSRTHLSAFNALFVGGHVRLLPNGSSVHTNLVMP
jgi:prepilin-type N-terminal cleavage/methylation domain-containing protein/prepilin-type processing-associated H-X9-DG protein